MAVKQDPVIERFLDNVWAERGLSDNSLQSYRHDLLHLQNSLAIRNKTLEVSGGSMVVSQMVRNTRPAGVART